ncbi:MAG: FAD-dependent oxidoreductase, partial [bacterium]
MNNRLGVFICHCGHNIAGSVDVKRVAEIISRERDVFVATEYIYMCSSPGQDLLEKSIKEHNLTGVVVAACSPTLHETTFRNAASRAGINPYRLEIANIREQCSWPHYANPEEATRKAIIIIRAMLEKVRRNSILYPLKIKITPKVLILGGGVSGIQAALDIADAGYEVYLVEKESSIGGRMVELSETFPTLDCPQCILTPKMTELAQNPKIHLMAYSELESISGYVGAFNVKIKHKQTYVNWDLCNGCGSCIIKCPAKAPSEFDHMLGKRKAIFVPFPQAVPNKPRIDRDNCLYFKKGICRICEKVCDKNAIEFDQQERYTEVEVGAILVATGFKLYDISQIGEYGYGKFKDVVDAFQFERLLSASGPTGG